MDLTSADIVRLVRDLEAYGARCEERKKGIMIKLPARTGENPFVAKFIHRSPRLPPAASTGRPSRPSENLFDASVFMLDRFPR